MVTVVRPSAIIAAVVALHLRCGGAFARKDNDLYATGRCRSFHFEVGFTNAKTDARDVNIRFLKDDGLHKDRGTCRCGEVQELYYISLRC